MSVIKILNGGLSMSYFSLHNHSHYSNTKFPDSICKENDLIDYAYEIGLAGVAITDHDMVSSYVKAGKHLAKRQQENQDDERWQNFKLIYGNEIYLCRNDMNKENYEKSKDKFFHFILLAKNEIGNQQIRELSSRAWKRSYMMFHRRVPTYYSDLEEIIGAAPGHLIGSTACLGGWLGTQILAAREYENKDENTYNEYYSAIQKWIEKMQSIFGKNDFYIELQPGLSKDQLYANKKFLELGEKLDIKCILTTDSHYLSAEDRKIHKAYLNSKEGEREVDDFYEAAYMMNKSEIWGRMKDYVSKDVFNSMIDNTFEIGHKCKRYDILKPLKIPYLPIKEKQVTYDNGLGYGIELEYNVTCDWEETGDNEHIHRFLNSSELADRELAGRCLIKLQELLKDDSRYTDEYFEKCVQACNHELGIIWNSGEKQGVKWSKYLLQVADYIDIFWSEGDSIVCPSRGSAGASYVCYLLGIIQIDRTREKTPLHFERFINPDRVSVLDKQIYS